MNPYDGLPPMPGEIAKFINVVEKDNPEYPKKIKEMNTTYFRLNNLFEGFIKRCETPLGTINDMDKRTPDIKIIYAYSKLKKYVLKHRNIFREINAQIGSQISIISVFFEGLKAQEFAATFDFDGFQKHAKDTFKRNTRFQKYYRRIKSLQSYILYWTQQEKIPTVTLDNLTKEAPKITPLFNTMYLYSPPNIFLDSIIEIFLSEERKTKEFQQIIKDITGEGTPMPQKIRTRRKSQITPKKVPNPMTFNKYFVSFLTQLQQKMTVALCDEQKYILRSSFLRVVFDDAYVFLPQISASNPVYPRNCFIISHLCPNDLSMPDVFTEEEKNTPFIDFIPQLEKFKEINEILSTIQFYINPIDLAFEVCKVSRLIDEFASERSPTNEAIKLSFDDFFIIFIVCLSLASITNAEGIKFVEEFYNDLENSQMVKHSMTSLSAGIKYINDFVEENKTQELGKKIERIAKMLE